MHCVWEKGMSGRPVQVMISGLFDPEGSTLSPSSSSTTFKLSFKKEKFDLVQNNGNIGFFESVAEFPIPEPAPTVPKKEPTVISDVPISECQWLVGLWVGVIEQEKETRSLEISLSKEDMKATYGVTGNKTKTGYTKLEISGDNIHFETGSKSKVNLHKVSDSQLEGTFETSAGRITKAKFIKY